MSTHNICFCGEINEPEQDKTNRTACAPSEDSDQPGHPPSLIRVFAVRMKKSLVLSYLLSAQRRLWSAWADAQADLSLCWAHMPFCWLCGYPCYLELCDHVIRVCSSTRVKRFKWTRKFKLQWNLHRWSPPNNTHTNFNSTFSESPKYCLTLTNFPTTPISLQQPITCIWIPKCGCCREVALYINVKYGERRFTAATQYLTPG